MKTISMDKTIFVVLLQNIWKITVFDLENTSDYYYYYSWRFIDIYLII